MRRGRRQSCSAAVAAAVAAAAAKNYSCLDFWMFIYCLQIINNKTIKKGFVTTVIYRNHCDEIVSENDGSRLQDVDGGVRLCQGCRSFGIFCSIVHSKKAQTQIFIARSLLQTSVHRLRSSHKVNNVKHHIHHQTTQL